jgi:hypothetical protein
MGTKHKQAAVPFGYDLAADGATLVENDREQEILRVVRELQSEGESMQCIKDELMRRGIPKR